LGDEERKQKNGTVAREATRQPKISKNTVIWGSSRKIDERGEKGGKSVILLGASTRVSTHGPKKKNNQKKKKKKTSEVLK